jgi:hypothetical protein
MLFGASAVTGASHTPVGWRAHLSVNDARGDVLYVLTDIHHVDDSGGSTELLILDKTTDQRFVMTSKYDIEHHRSVMQISDVTGKKYLRRSYALPSAAKTRDELSAESERNPQVFELADSLITIETPASSYTAHESELSGNARNGRWVSDLRESLDPAFLEALERMRESLFGTTTAERFYSTLAKFVFHGGCSPDAATAKVVAETPDCSFDKSFGFPCSDRQVERIRKAEEEKTTLDHY